METFGIFDEIDRQRRSGRPFCIATVVRTADVTSAKAGAKAVVTAEAEILGHLGGACVTRAVLRAAAEALAAGEARLIRVKPSETVVALTDADGAQLFKSGCPSGGTVDLLIEPYELPPVVAVFGATPVARAIAAQARLLGFRTALSEGTEGPPDALRFPGADVSALPLGPRDFAVVASQGVQDLACLRAALGSPAGRVSMIASRRKAAALAAKLAAAGLDPARIAQLKSPAGLDIGAVDPREIALSVLAEIVAWSRAARHPDRQQSGSRA
ncbi:XdhC family protein [Mangrovicoccus sp. HB161399]|uniref:XdhC family protein n=1 Tax=Mangrovicoccus sp. HB161399 TaxID=2720392 RepID=UPI0015566011|nr:XdhC/CoxI family protein [Mangrovicoccus sp. HB161399]